MIAAALLQVAAATAAPVPAEASEIVVIGRRLAEWRGTWGEKKGMLACRTTRSTGDAEIDALGCRTLVACAAPKVPEFRAIAATKLPKRERNRRMTAASQAMMPCLTQTREREIAALADRRAGV